jgi:type II secretory pathway component GspD/PulD (secretin)
MLILMASCASGKLKPESTDTSTIDATAEKEFSLPDIEKPVIDDKASGQAPAPPAADLEAVLVESTGEQDYIILNFENTDIKTIVATFGELLGINYILTPGVSGSVTIQSFSRFPTKNLFHVFQSILEVNGLTAVKDGDFYRIVPIDSAKTQPADVVSGADVKYALDSAFVTQLFPLKNVKASEISSILTQLMPRGTNLIVYEPSNLLIVTSLPHTLAKFRKIIGAIDVDSLDSGSVRTFVYHVENGEAKKLEEILNTVYLSRPKSKAAPTKPSVPRKPGARPSGSLDLPGDLGDITVSAYEDINALLIKCSPRSYVALLQVLKKIDVPPRQVLIEVMIAEITLDDETSLGLEWVYKLNSGNFFGMNPSRFVDSGSVIGPGDVVFGDSDLGKFAAVSSGKVDTDSYLNLFTAMAQDNDLNVLASPNILAMDNKEAEIKIGSEVPTATSTSQSSEGITTSSQIQYKTVGTILTVTPHITEKGNVSMKIVVESSDIGTSTRIGTGDYPSFSTRKATTNALIKDGHALFLGGLIRNKKAKTRSGIPILSRIPILGYLFGSRSWSNEKTEMFVMVTPHVINNVEDADILSSRFNDRIKVIREKILKIEKKKKTVKTQAKKEPAKAEARDPVKESKEPEPAVENKPAAQKVDVPQPYVP